MTLNSDYQVKKSIRIKQLCSTSSWTRTKWKIWSNYGIWM